MTLCGFLVLLPEAICHRQDPTPMFADLSLVVGDILLAELALTAGQVVLFVFSPSAQWTGPIDPGKELPCPALYGFRGKALQAGNDQKSVLSQVLAVDAPQIL